MRRKMLLVALGLTWLVGTPGMATAAHPYDVPLKDLNGAPIKAGTNAIYSPKQTCGACHVYESDPADVVKQQTVGGVANPEYTVKVATHGVSAGYHFQQGMNVAWGQVQRDFYKVPSFTSSPGMIGKY